MGDGSMHWEAALSEDEKVRAFHVWHEHCTVATADGGFMMHAQELDTIRRCNLPVLICVLNDGAYGAEIHKLRADKLDDSGSMFGPRPLAGIAKGFGLHGALGFHILDQVVAPMMRRSVMRPR